TERRTAVDYALMLKKISDEHFAPAKKIVLVQDNLNTHRPSSLYAAFPAAEARRLVGRFEWRYTPKHGSWPRHGRIRTQRPFTAMPRPANPGHRHAGLCPGQNGARLPSPRP